MFNSKSNIHFPLLLLLLLVATTTGSVVVFLFGRSRRSETQNFTVEKDVYEALGNKEGIAQHGCQTHTANHCPEMKKLESLVNYFEIGQDWTALVDVGDAYARGCFPFYGADPSTAVRIYKVASTCPDRIVAARAMSRYVDTRLHPISTRDSCGQPFPAELARRLVRHAEYHIQRCPPTINRARTSVQHHDPTSRPVRKPTEVVAAVAPPAPPAPPAPLAPVAVDKQNVHDHSIAQTTKRNARDIVGEREEGEGADYDRIELIDSVMCELRRSKLSEKQVADAFRVLVSLVPDRIESIGCSQLDVLNATKAKIDGVSCKDLRKNLLETLGKNLASGIERGHVVCSTGKVARIVSSLEGTDLVKRKTVPMEIVRREIGALASKVRNDVLDGLSAKKAAEYDAGSAAPKVSTTMRDRFEAQASSIYIDELGLSPDVLKPIVALYSKEF